MSTEIFQVKGEKFQKKNFMQATSRLLQLTDEPAVRKALLQIVIALEDNFHAREDLLQEAFLCFWSRTRQFPGKRLSWYLQNVNFYLHHLKTSGRSLDSPKRRGAQAAFSDASEGWDQLRDSLDIDEGIMSAVNAGDIFSVLVARLAATDQTILVALAEGLEDRDIAKNLHVSEMFVIRHRRGIAKVAIKLGINPLRPPRFIAPLPISTSQSRHDWGTVFACWFE